MPHKALGIRAFFVTIEPQATQRVRCRPIADGDLDGLAGLLTEGFPRSSLAYWSRGFERWKQTPVVESVPRYGYVLDNGTAPVGVILLISSLHGEQIVSNLSCLYVRPELRTHSTLLIS